MAAAPSIPPVIFLPTSNHLHQPSKVRDLSSL
ncbi:uncharacterized protein G2W53_006886 [Senna tora]|uniref:Uncharacterized protein n=1 Tax=Senna tora TaxID=362788 RepID=A0A834X5F8_9FABA|nr:uncharacterized protein G2W53_006886 [Senna tora]